MKVKDGMCDLLGFQVELSNIGGKSSNLMNIPLNCPTHANNRLLYDSNLVGKNGRGGGKEKKKKKSS